MIVTKKNKKQPKTASSIKIQRRSQPTGISHTRASIVHWFQYRLARKVSHAGQRLAIYHDFHASKTATLDHESDTTESDGSNAHAEGAGSCTLKVSAGSLGGR